MATPLRVQFRSYRTLREWSTVFDLGSAAENRLAAVREAHNLNAQILYTDQDQERFRAYKEAELISIRMTACTRAAGISDELVEEFQQKLFSNDS
jgi:hypothetical protein